MNLGEVKTMLNAKRISAVLFLLILVSLSICFAQTEYTIPSDPVPSKDGSIISAEEHEMIRRLIPYFDAINNKDFEKIRALDHSWNRSDSQLQSYLQRVKSYTLVGVENASYNDGTLVAKVTYTIEFITPESAEKKYVWNRYYIALRREDDQWVIIKHLYINTIIPGDAASIQAMFKMNTKFVKRYGVDDLSKWDGL